jgi:hypothetical protein
LLKGVTSAVNEPWKLVLTVMIRSSERLDSALR